MNAREQTTMSARKPAANTTKTAATQTAVQSRKSTALLRGSGRLIAHPPNCRPRRPIFIPGRPLRPTRGWREDTRNQLRYKEVFFDAVTIQTAGQQTYIFIHFHYSYIIIQMDIHGQTLFYLQKCVVHLHNGRFHFEDGYSWKMRECPYVQ